MRDKITTAVELVGLGLVTTGFALIWAPLGFIAAGAALVGLGIVQGES